jgi:hypothetical protein
MGIADGVIEADGKVIYEAKDLQGGSFQAPKQIGVIRRQG